MANGYSFYNLEWHPYPEHWAFYKIEEGVLKYMPMRSDGSMVVEQIGEVNYSAMIVDRAARCREIENELQYKC